MKTLVKDNKLSVSEATSLLIKAVLKMPGDEIIALLNELEKNGHEAEGELRADYCSEVLFSVEEKFYTGYSTNINSSGVFIETKDEFEPGQKLTLSVQLPNHLEYVKLTGEITGTSENGIDVLFDDVIEESMDIEPEKGNGTVLDENYC